jgi:tetracycline 7-halogenase / FADH2 O2-dependent halogenase
MTIRIAPSAFFVALTVGGKPVERRGVTMIQFDVDLAVIGSGFGGSLMAMIGQRLGLRTVLIDRASHPRFTIGESSTPVANMVLRDLVQRYGLSRVEPICRYATAEAQHPDVVMGIKRGFSYFRHEQGELFQVREDRSNEWLVPGNPDDQTADAHWLRSDVDRFLFKQVRASGIATMERTDVTEVTRDDNRWCVAGYHGEEPVRIWAEFVLDASGGTGVMLKALDIPSSDETLKTKTRTLYGHFTGVGSWYDAYQQAGGRVEDHPYRCDEAAVHHVIDGGWMWQLQFRNGVTSAGLVLDQDRHPYHPDRYPDEEWHLIVERYPTLAQQFAGTKLHEATRHLIGTSRLQRIAERSAGEGWAGLPNVGGFVDPLHGTGIAQILCGIERLAAMLEHSWRRDDLTEHLEEYSRTVRTEIEFIDSLLHACYLSMDDFSRFVSTSKLYFVASSMYERRFREGRIRPEHAFLCADDDNLRQTLAQIVERLTREAEQPAGQRSDPAEYDRWIGQLLDPLQSGES